MIIGIGVDLCEIQRVIGLLTRWEDAFPNRVLSKVERTEYDGINKNKRALMLAKRFAAKEAFSKALGTGIGRGFGFRDLTVQHDAFGKPEMVFNAENPVLQECLTYRVHLSLSDERSHAIAFCTIES